MPTRFDPTTDDARERYRKAERIDGRSGAYSPYQYSRTDLRVALNAALATRRPLLLRGEAGAGKSTVAYDVAVVLGWTYYERVVSSRTTASDLLWHFDAIERLNAASATNANAGPITEYLHPRALWWVIDPISADKHGRDKADPVRVRGDGTGAVLLLDEIDKADPDLPNDLLVPIGDGRFRVPELGKDGNIERTRDYLIVITSNGERELPPAFLRRCVCQDLTTPDKVDDLMRIAEAHRRELVVDAKTKAERAQLALDRGTAKELITRMLEIRAACKSGQHRPGTAEILDALHACFELGIGPDHADWRALTLAMGWKNTDRPPDALA